MSSAIEESSCNVQNKIHLQNYKKETRKLHKDNVKQILLYSYAHKLDNKVHKSHRTTPNKTIKHLDNLKRNRTKEGREQLTNDHYQPQQIDQTKKTLLIEGGVFSKKERERG